MWVSLRLCFLGFLFIVFLYAAPSSVRFQDWNNYESDAEDFARTFCQDLAFQDPEVEVTTFIHSACKFAIMLSCLGQIAMFLLACNETKPSSLFSFPLL